MPVGKDHSSARGVAADIQHEFPITDNLGKVHGILTRDDMIAGLRRSGAGTPVAEVMRADIPPCLSRFIVMQECRWPGATSA